MVYIVHVTSECYPIYPLGYEVCVRVCFKAVLIYPFEDIVFCVHLILGLSITCVFVKECLECKYVCLKLA